jgi:hypothetical protein
LTIEVVPSLASGSPSPPDRWEGGLVIPVVALDEDSVLAQVLASELPVLNVEGSVNLDDLGEVLDNLLVIPDLMVLARVATNVPSKPMQASIELFKHNRLHLNLADGLGDNLLGHLLQDEETLLDDVNLLGPADEFVLLLDEHLLELVTVPVVDAVEIIKALEGLVAVPLVEGVVDGDVNGDMSRRGVDGRLDVVHGRWDVVNGSWDMHRDVLQGSGMVDRRQDMMRRRRVGRNVDGSGMVNRGLMHNGSVHRDMVEGARRMINRWGDMVHRRRIDWNVFQGASNVVDRRRLMLGRRRNGVMNRCKDHL